MVLVWKLKLSAYWYAHKKTQRGHKKWNRHNWTPYQSCEPGCLKDMGSEMYTLLPPYYSVFPVEGDFATTPYTIWTSLMHLHQTWNKDTIVPGPCSRIHRYGQTNTSISSRWVKFWSDSAWKTESKVRRLWWRQCWYVIVDRYECYHSQLWWASTYVLSAVASLRITLPPPQQTVLRTEPVGWCAELCHGSSFQVLKAVKNYVPAKVSCAMIDFLLRRKSSTSWQVWQVVVSALNCLAPKLAVAVCLTQMLLFR